ncbi:hypothetical protein DL98DRAFT_656860 [Cadophora sp. DSE1049]|nr:hypothetical protein DL98DRAFT_656860 [Cadophora sp. DSE1049]
MKTKRNERLRGAATNFPSNGGTKTIATATPTSTKSHSRLHEAITTQNAEGNKHQSSIGVALLGVALQRSQKNLQQQKTWEELHASLPENHSLRVYSSGHWHIVSNPTFPSGAVYYNNKAPAVFIPWEKETTSTNTSAPSSQFHSFRRLPTELRTLVWKAAVPEPRVIEVKLFVGRYRAEVSIGKSPLDTSMLYCNEILGSRDVFWAKYEVLQFIAPQRALGLQPQTDFIAAGVIFRPLHRVAIDAERETLLMDLDTLHGLDLYRNNPFDTVMRLNVMLVRNFALSFGDLKRDTYNADADLNNRIMQVARYIKTNCPNLEQLNIVAGSLNRHRSARHAVIRLVDFGSHLEDVIYDRKPKYLAIWLPGSNIRLGPWATSNKITEYKQHFQNEISNEPASSGWANIDLKFSILARQTPSSCIL